ncbi:putative bifunctional diguanylate cyclase/phosphodiesterase [Sphingobium fontiphilum]|uniref:putative bifunctional diguanylate cyclase/phosphodiesterase n=1 Tax=Sphingobium fontiphilum TaxID=944425 RepID=UPI001FE74E4F|nr:EAL domain-containing protein [Sphingobium fontiphilum]
MPLEFDVPLTVTSAVVAILAFWAALHVLGIAPSLWRSIGAALVAAGGIAIMHFVGMMSIIAPVSIHYAWPPILISFVVAAIALAAAFAGFTRLKGNWRIAVPAALTILAIVALHFTAMSATTLKVDPRADVNGVFSPHGWLIPTIAFATFALLGLVLTSSFVDRMLTDLKGLTGATLEGILIVSDGRIVEVNDQLCAMLDMEADALLGARPGDWFVAHDYQPLEGERPGTVEASALRPTTADQVLEIASHQIEYRGRLCQVLAVRDLTERKRAERAIAHMASHDALTDLPNRVHMAEMLGESLRAMGSGGMFAVLALDLDRFKAVNDIFGHAAGDDILKRVATILRNAVGPDDVVARIGGDEFVILQRHVCGDDDVRALASRILDSFAQEMDIARDPMAVGVSIGVAVFPRDGEDAESLRHNADTALYRAKQEGRGIACFFDQQMDEQMRERRALEYDLRQALSRGEFYLAFQPLVSTAFSAVVGYEALLRWSHPDRGDVPPEVFIPIAEDVGVILPIGEWVLREACSIAARWPDYLSIAVNVSAVQFRVGNLASVVDAALRDSGLNPKRLELEMTESVLLRNRSATIAILHDLKARGVNIVMDDFGTGYSSLSNLRSFPFDKIKIDRSFVSSVADDGAARSIIRAIVGLGRSLNMPVVAEGVETDEQRQMVLEEGCRQAQGYLFGMPAPVGAELAAQLRLSGGGSGN